MVLSRDIHHLLPAVVFGIIAFSGTTVMATASLLAPRYSKSKTLITVYSTTLLLSWIGAILAVPLASMELQQQNILTALILFGTALQLLPWKFIEGLKNRYQPSRIIWIVLTTMILYGLKEGAWWRLSWHLDMGTLEGAAVSVAAGFSVTAAVLVLSSRLHVDFQSSLTQTIWALGGVVVLLTVAMGDLGLRLPSGALLLAEIGIVTLGLGVPVFKRMIWNHRHPV